MKSRKTSLSGIMLFGACATLWVSASMGQTGGSSDAVGDVQPDHPVHVTFDEMQYELTPSAGPGGSIVPAAPVMVASGGSQQFTAQPDIGSKVDIWLLDGNKIYTSGDSYTISNVQANHTIHVTFEQTQYTITPSAGPYGSIDPKNPVGAEPGSSQEFTAEPATGYKVDVWYLDDKMVQTGGNAYTLFSIAADHAVHVTFARLLTQSLGDIDFDEADDFTKKIVHNNVINGASPGGSRVHVERIEGRGPDPKGAMEMHSLMDLDPASPHYGMLVNARAKASFAEAFTDEVVVRFRYLFSTGGPGVEMVVYLSDVPLLLEHGDSLRDEHYLEVARLPAPPAGRPGSVGSQRYAVFEKVVWTGQLNLAGGTWIELELIEPAVSNSVTIDDWGSAVQCYGICLDINWDNLIDVADFLKVIGECGQPAVGERACYEGVFSADGVVDSLDTVSWDWALNSDGRLLSLCQVPLTASTAQGAMASPSLGVPVAASTPRVVMAAPSLGVPVAASIPRVTTAPPPVGSPFAGQMRFTSLPYELSDLLIVGKRGTNAPGTKLKDRLYAFDRDGGHRDSFELPGERGNIRLVQDEADGLYVINSESGLVRLDEANQVIIPPSTVALAGTEEPRTHQPAFVSIGIQGEGPDIFGRPILDVALDADYAYVLPVVVSPAGGEPYLAAAKLLLQDGADTPYQVVRIYDDPPLAGDNQYRNALRELEIDDAGNLYVLNAHSLNESDILWRYASDGTMERLDLARSDSEDYCPAPTAMHVSRTTGMLYLASSRQNEDNTNTSTIRGYSTQGDLTHTRSVEIAAMDHVAGITDDPATGCLWVLGFSMYYVPEYPNPTMPPFYYPCLARVEPDSDHVQAQSLYDPSSHDLALPLSVVWTGN